MELSHRLTTYIHVDPGFFVAFIAIFALCRWLHCHLRRTSISSLPGPSKSDWLFGNLPDLNFEEVGVAHIAWQKQFGHSFKIHGLAGEEYLMISDPKAIQHIFNNSNTYVRQIQNSEMYRMIGGPGLTVVTGDDHKRQRRVMQPAFGIPHVKTLFPVMSRHAEKLVSTLKADIDTGKGGRKAKLNVHDYASRATLDAIGDYAFGHQFGALENKQDELRRVLSDINASFPSATKAALFSQYALEWLPTAVIPFLPYLPIKKFSQLGACRKKLALIADRLVQTKAEAHLMGLEGGKDLMSLLMRGNAKEQADTKLSNTEVRSEIATITVAGHATTTNTFTFALWELAKNLDLQRRIREEIRATALKLREEGEAEIPFREYDSMQLLVSFLKEVLRFHPASFNGNKQATADDVIPLLHPVKLTSGRIVNEIPVSKGQKIWVNIPGYNRLPEVFGDDAYEFNVDRWLNRPVSEKRSQAAGVYANLVSFGHGPRACIGWRLSVWQLQMLLVNTLTNFEFTLPANGPRICRSAAITMIPTVEGERTAGPTLSLDVTILDD